MRNRALALVLVCVLASLGAASNLAPVGSVNSVEEVATIILPAPGEAFVSLYEGCNNIALTFPDGTPPEAVAGAVVPSGTLKSMWRYEAAQSRFEGFSPAAPRATDLTSLEFLDAVWLCVVPCDLVASESPEDVLNRCVAEPLVRLTEAAYQRIVGTTALPYHDPDGNYTIKYLPAPTMFDVDTGATTWEEYAERSRKAAEFFRDRGVDPCRIFVNWGADPILLGIPMPPGLDFGCPVNV